ncbi:MAG: CYTH domain-containing protein [Oscillospiraceae bacterium]|nr:CYTH domain-containing protein [Oscillospiraceae bacterium]
MGKELEYKLNIVDEQALAVILTDPRITALRQGDWQERHMKTTYYDAPDRRFSARLWTFRHRMEGDKSVVCVKTPTEDFHTRGEYQVEASGVNLDSVEALLLVGAPRELVYLYGAGDVAPICGAEFTRKSCMLRFDDGSRAELAGDHGILHGETEKVGFNELELELFDGNPDKMLEFVDYLKAQYSLQEQPMSKFSRAQRLK